MRFIFILFNFQIFFFLCCASVLPWFFASKETMLEKERKKDNECQGLPHVKRGWALHGIRERRSIAARVCAREKEREKDEVCLVLHVIKEWVREYYMWLEREREGERPALNLPYTACVFLSLSSTPLLIINVSIDLTFFWLPYPPVSVCKCKGVPRTVAKALGVLLV